jgi:hypothetical protein
MLRTPIRCRLVDEFGALVAAALIGSRDRRFSRSGDDAFHPST